MRADPYVPRHRKGSTMPPSTLLAADARNRATRALLIGLALNVCTAVAATIYSIVVDPSPIVWSVFGAGVGRTAMQAASSYIMRLRLDPSSFPTPLPPDPVPDPAAPIDPEAVTGSDTTGATETYDYG